MRHPQLFPRVFRQSLVWYYPPAPVMREENLPRRKEWATRHQIQIVMFQQNDFGDTAAEEFNSEMVNSFCGQVIKELQ
jgi:hypothetical protein